MSTEINKIIRLAFCTDGIFPHAIGGMQRHSRLLLEELVQFENLVITVFHPHDFNVFNNQKLKEIQIPPIDSKKLYLRECYQYSKRVYNHLISNHFDIVYSQGLSVWYNMDKINAKIIVNPHGLEPYQGITTKEKWMGLPFRMVFNRIFKRADKVVSLGGKLTNILSNIVTDSKIAILPNAVNLPPGISDKNFKQKLKVLFVGRFAHNKGIDILMNAISILNSKSTVKYDYILAGKGPLFTKYSQENKYENVRYLGFVSDADLVNLYADCHLFVLPTLYEGMPTVVLEAMSYGMTTIVSDVGATAELIDENTGYLIEKKNSEALVFALEKYFHSDEILKKELGQNSIQKVRERFTWQQVAKAHVQLFNELKSILN